MLLLLVSVADFFSKFIFFFRNTIRLSKCLDPDQNHHYAILCPNCLKRLSADDKMEELRVQKGNTFIISVKQTSLLLNGYYHTKVNLSHENAISNNVAF